jgi:ribosomal protein S27AE
MRCPECGVGALILAATRQDYFCLVCEYRELAGSECPYCAGVPMQRRATRQVCPACSFTLPLHRGRLERG